MQAMPFSFVIYLGGLIFMIVLNFSVLFSSQWYSFEFLVVCTGKYGDVPKIPEFPHNKGPEIFQGKVLHALDYCKLDEEASTQLFGGKKVVVVGYKKSAIDLALECAQANQGIYEYR